mmetsp:Transcript_10745/g.33141  ORF Transcript_10745/g.33141 Transcript_10745/m.33141 type:complete len:274 (+) Transcript_10745:46-867(+)
MATPCLLLSSLPLCLHGGSLQLGPLLGSGSHGRVYRALYREKELVAKLSLSWLPSSSMYLQTEEAVCQALAARGGESAHLPTLVGSCVHEGVRALLWKPSGDRDLERVLLEGEKGRERLAEGMLGCKETQRDACSPALARAVLTSLLKGLCHMHAAGIVHRDVKPANLMLHPEAQQLVFIDFGSACDLASWCSRRGFSHRRVPCAVLYCPPEQRLDLNYPFSYDVFSAALVWLRTCVPVSYPRKVWLNGNRLHPTPQPLMRTVGLPSIVSARS